MALLPPDLVGCGGRIMGRGKPGGFRCVGRCVLRMGRHVSDSRRMSCGSGGGNGRRVADLPSRSVRLCRQSTAPSDSHLATGEGSQAVDGLTRTLVARVLHFEQRQCSLGTIGGPYGQHSPVVFAKGQGSWSPFHGREFSRRLTWQTRLMGLLRLHSEFLDHIPAGTPEWGVLASDLDQQIGSSGCGPPDEDAALDGTDLVVELLEEAQTESPWIPSESGRSCTWILKLATAKPSAETRTIGIM